MYMDDYEKARLMYKVAPKLKCQLEDAIWAVYPFVRISISESLYRGDAVVEAKYSLFDTVYGYTQTVNLSMYESDADGYKQYILEKIVRNISSGIANALINSRVNRNKA